MAEDAAPGFKIGPPLGDLPAGTVWGLAWTLKFDIAPYLLLWLVSSFLTGMLLYIVWLELVIHRYRNPLNNPAFSEMLERAKNRTGYSGHVDTWVRKSDKLILMGSQTPLFTAILVSDIALKDIIENAENGEVVLAYKVLHFSGSKRLSRITGAGLAFVAGIMFEGLALMSLIDALLNDHASLLFLALLTVLAFALILSTIAEGRGRENPIERVEKLYGIPTAVALMRVFGKAEIPEEKVEEYFREFKPKAEEEERVDRRHMKRRSIYAWIVVAAVTFSFSILSRQLGPVTTIVVFLLSICLGAIAAALVFVTQFFMYMFSQMKGKGPVEEQPKDAVLCQDSLAAETEELLTREKGFSGHRVRLVNEETDKGALVVLRPGGLTPKDSVCYVPASIVKLIHEPDMLAPYMVYDATAGKMIKKQNIYGLALGSPALILFIVSIFVALSPDNLFVMGLSLLLASFLLLFLWMAISALIVRAWSRSIMFGLDISLAEKHPGHTAALRILLDEQYATEPGTTSLSERLKHLECRRDSGQQS